jgi:tRNA (guanine37-N1)-methyltransferase
MRITVITLFPTMFQGFLAESILKRAQEKGLVSIDFVDPRSFVTDSYKTVDDKPYGGGIGMVMKVEPIVQALESLDVKKGSNGARIAITSPRGVAFTQEKAHEYAVLDHLVIVTGRYEGVDERVHEYVDEEVSLGDFVMTGGEIAAAAMVDAVARLVPGVLEKEGATALESFFTVALSELIAAVGNDPVLEKLKTAGVENVRLLEYPQYTRPEEFANKKVPEVLLSGNHAEIEKWRLQQAFAITRARRPDLLKSI